MIYVAIALAVAGNSVFLTAYLAHRSGRLTDKALAGWCTIANTINLVAAALVHNTPISALITASLVLSAWAWWHGGGGDGTRRRLRSWARKFTGVRRTAPAGAV